jgi:hypothetical protein
MVSWPIDGSVRAKAYRASRGVVALVDGPARRRTDYEPPTAVVFVLEKFKRVAGAVADVEQLPSAMASTYGGNDPSLSFPNAERVSSL